MPSLDSDTPHFNTSSLATLVTFQNQIGKQDEVLGGKQSDLNKYQAQIKEATQSQTSVLQQIKMMRTMKDRTEKKLKWGLNDLKVSSSLSAQFRPQFRGFTWNFLNDTTLVEKKCFSYKDFARILQDFVR